MRSEDSRDKAGLLGGMAKIAGAFLTRRVTMQVDQIPYVFTRVPYGKLINWALVESAARLQPLRAWGMPTHLQLEPAGICNLKCALCPVTEGMNRGGGIMPLGLFQQLIREIGDHLFLILLWDWGEPFMNPHLCEMIEFAKERNIKVVVSTNGHLLKNPELAERLVYSGLDTLIVAIDGISQQTYEQYRGKGRLGDALAGLKAVVQAKRKLGRRHPLINFRFIAMRHNEHEIPKLNNFARETGADALTIKTLNTCSNDTYGDHATQLSEREELFQPQDTRYRRFAVAPGSSERARWAWNSCKNLWNAPSVHWDGTVCPCTFDYDERFVLGRLMERPFAEIWNGPGYRKMRRDFKQQCIHFCRECSYSFAGGNCQYETVKEAFFFNLDAIAV
jgi:radical SAM protein with 4Fe4S-binding SPASM domain